MAQDSTATAFTVATDDLVARTIAGAQKRLVVVAPAVSVRVAREICDRCAKLEPHEVTLILDGDPEVYRLGYGQLEGLEVLAQTAERLGVSIRRQPGLRIGVVIADTDTLIYVPTPQLVEAGPNTHTGANAIRLGQPLSKVEREIGLGKDMDPRIGRDSFKAQDIERVQGDLRSNPPQKFDLARKVTVFNAFIEFVDLHVRGTDVAKQTVTLPNHLLAFADENARQRWRSTFRLLDAEDALSGAEIENDRRLLIRRFLRVIPRYGTVVMQRDKGDFQEALRELENSVEEFGKRVKAGIQGRIDKSINELCGALLPSLTQDPPAEWIPSSGRRPDGPTVQRLLEQDLRRAFGTADQWVRKMRVSSVFKGVTYELLSDPDFLAAATQAIPELERFHREFKAVEGTSREGAKAGQA